MDIKKFLSCYDSTTKLFKTISDHYYLEVLDSAINGDRFTRRVLIHVANLPVMFGISHTKLTNKHFLQMLTNASNNPIGIQLFAPNSNIKRTNMIIDQVAADAIDCNIVQDYLAKNNIRDKLHRRQSQFIYNNEIMELTEYCLPNLLTVLMSKDE
jgi:chorismate-pyruvate lyase